MQKDTTQIKVCMNQSLHKTINLRSPIRLVWERRTTVPGCNGHQLRLPWRHLVWRSLMARSTRASDRFWSARSWARPRSWVGRSGTSFAALGSERSPWHMFPTEHRYLVTAKTEYLQIETFHQFFPHCIMMLKTERADERNEILPQCWTAASGMSLGSVCTWWTGNWPPHFAAAWVVCWLRPCLLVWRSSSCLQNSKISMLKQWRKCFHLETNFHFHCDWCCNVIVSQ